MSQERLAVFDSSGAYSTRPGAKAAGTRGSPGAHTGQICEAMEVSQVWRSGPSSTHTTPRSGPPTLAARHALAEVEAEGAAQHGVP